MQRKNTANLAGGFVALTLAAAAAAAADAPQAPHAIVLKAAHLFDSVSGKLVNHGVVVVVGKKIRRSGRMQRFPRAPRQSIWATQLSCRDSLTHMST